MKVCDDNCKVILDIGYTTTVGGYVCASVKCDIKCEESSLVRTLQIGMLVKHAAVAGVCKYYIGLSARIWVKCGIAECGK